jgi:hypothetical protein
VKHIRMAGLCLVVVFAIASVAAVSASAASPEWGQCVAKPGTGKYEDKNCAIKGKGKTAKKEYEWEKGSAGIKDKAFRGEGGAGSLVAHLVYCEEGLKRVPGECKPEEEREEVTTTVECSSALGSGELKGKAEVTGVEVFFKGCSIEGVLGCSNVENQSNHEKEIEVNSLIGKLGLISAKDDEVGLLLTPAKKKGEFASFDCGGLVTVHVGEGTTTEGSAYSPGETGKPTGNDGIIAPISPVNQMASILTEKYTINEGGENLPTNFEGKSGVEELEAYQTNASQPNLSSKWSKAGEQIAKVSVQLCNNIIGCTEHEEAEVKS